LPESTTAVLQPQTFDIQGLVAPALPSNVDNLVPVVPITNPSVIATSKPHVVTDNSTPVTKSDAQLLDDMMSSERGDCSPYPALIIEDEVPLFPKPKPVRTSKAIPFFPKPVPKVAGSRRQPGRAAKNPAALLTDQLQSKEIQRLFNKQNPQPAKVRTAKGVSSSGQISQYDTLPEATQHIRVDVVRGFEDSLKWKVDLDCSLTHPSITPVCENRVNTLIEAQTMDFGGKCSFIHCPGQPMESVLHNFSRSWAADLENTSAILALPESDYNRLWDKIFFGNLCNVMVLATEFLIIMNEVSYPEIVV
jgi:hypothetical protein